VSRPSRIVVGYQGGPTGHDAVEFARRWCRASGDRLLVVTVHPGPHAPGPARVDAEFVAYERAEADRLLEEARALVGTEVDADFRRVDAGSAAHGLSDLRQEEGSLLVLGASGAAGMRRTLPGSTAQRVLSGSESPVVVVPKGYAESPAGELRTVAAAFVGTPDGRVALEQAVRIAGRLSGGVRAVSVVPDTRVTPSLGDTGQFATDQREDYRRSLDEAISSTGAAGSGVEVVADLRDGPVVETLTELGPDDGDLLVCGSRGYGPVRRVLLGGVSSRVAQNARLPVVLTPRGDS